jgi:hypothetical protein
MIVRCQRCGRKNRIPQRAGSFKCGACGYLFSKADLNTTTVLNGAKEADRMKVRKYIGYLAALLILVGVFSPALSKPLLGSRVFLTASWFWGVLILALIFRSLLMIDKRRWRSAGLCGIAILLIDVLRFAAFDDEISHLRDALSREFPSPHGIESLIVQSAHLGWAWGPMFWGSVILIYACMVTKPKAGLTPILAAALALGVPAFLGVIRAQDEVRINVGSGSLAGASVEIKSLDGNMIDMHVASADGKVPNVDLGPGRYHVEVRGQGGQTTGEDVHIKQPAVSIVLQSGGGGGGTGPFVPTPPLPVIDCDDWHSRCMWLDAQEILENMKTAAEELERSQALSETAARLLEGEDTDVLIAEKLSHKMRSRILAAELKVVDLAIARVHEALAAQVRGDPPVSGWKPPVKPFWWDTPETIARKARVVADDDRYVEEIGQKARSELQQEKSEKVEVRHNDEGHSGQRLKTCGQIDDCRNAAVAATQGFPAVLNERH